MRLSHLILVVFLCATLFGVAREPYGRVAIVVFCTGGTVIWLALLAIVTLFRTLGALGEARSIYAHLEAIVATGLVLVVASVSINAVLWAGTWLCLRVVP
jgi:hypothetical protein